MYRFVFSSIGKESKIRSCTGRDQTVFTHYQRIMLGKAERDRLPMPATAASCWAK
jgi:hypothetical protein